VSKGSFSRVGSLVCLSMADKVYEHGSTDEGVTKCRSKSKSKSRF
jgi:hypothetical protein